jgi:hypothetical protein
MASALLLASCSHTIKYAAHSPTSFALHFIFLLDFYFFRDLENYP